MLDYATVKYTKLLVVIPNHTEYNFKLEHINIHKA